MLYKPDEVRYVIDHADCQAIVTEDLLNSVVREACQQASHEFASFVVGPEGETSFVLEAGRGSVGAVRGPLGRRVHPWRRRRTPRHSHA